MIRWSGIMHLIHIVIVEIMFSALDNVRIGLFACNNFREENLKKEKNRNRNNTSDAETSRPRCLIACGGRAKGGRNGDFHIHSFTYPHASRLDHTFIFSFLFFFFMFDLCSLLQTNLERERTVGR